MKRLDGFLLVEAALCVALLCFTGMHHLRGMQAAFFKLSRLMAMHDQTVIKQEISASLVSFKNAAGVVVFTAHAPVFFYTKHTCGAVVIYEAV